MYTIDISNISEIYIDDEDKGNSINDEGDSDES
jgi:hypothetical protein